MEGGQACSLANEACNAGDLRMTYWTLLWITMVGGQFDGGQTFVAYPSMQACEAATSAIGDTLPYDYTLKCKQTEVASASMKPKRRMK